VVRPARLVLVRHAEIDCSSNGAALLCGSHDARLNSTGQAQVELLRQRLLREREFAALYSSPLRRALDTARAAPEFLLRRLRLVGSLAEIHCGSVEGMSLEQIRRMFAEEWRRNEVQQDETFSWPGGETYRFFRKRILRAIRTIARMHPGDRVLIVTHAGVVNQVLGSLAGQSAARWDNFRPGNTALTEVLWSGNAGQVCRFDDRSHLC
jgi:broad specificity phosphatase PhoE